MKTNTLKIGIFILLAFISIVTYGWQCGSMGQNQYEYYPYNWISGSSSNTGITTTASYTGTLIATINPGGVETTVYFEWGSVYGWTSTTPRSVGSVNYNVTVTQTVTSLLPNTIYTYRLAILRAGDANPTYTENQSFTTAGRPSCTTEIATNVSSISATLNGTVNPNGLATTVYFQWGLSSSYGNNTITQTIGSGTVNVYVAANISGLSPYTSYFFRVVAVNSAGTVYGENRSFSSGPPYPIATTGSASSIGYASAVLNGLINPNNQDTTINFQWGTTAAYGNTTSAQVIPAGTSNVSVSANITSLSANTTYYFRLIGRNPAGTSNGAQQTFTTPPPPPTATTNPVATTTYNSAVLAATVNPNGLATTVYFQWGTSVPYGSSTSIQSIGSGITNAAVTATLTNLIGSTTYNYRVVAVNSSGTTYGSNQSFTTLIPPPTATTNPASSVTTATAILNAAVNPNGGATTVYFDWGTTISYGNTTTPTFIGSGTGFVSGITARIAGLTSSTVYNFRIVAINGNGTSYGINRTFTTSAQPPTVVTLPASGVTTGTFTLNATVNPNGVATSAYFQYGTSPSFYSYNSSTQTIGNGRTPVNVTASFVTSTPGLTYYFRIVAYNGGGYSYGTQQSFTVPLPGAPTVITTAATNITQTNAQLNGTVNSNGQSTTVYFRYRRTSPQGSWNVQSPPLDNGSGTTDWLVFTNAQLLPALLPNTSYDFQVYATNAAGTTYGGILTFVTLP